MTYSVDIIYKWYYFIYLKILIYTYTNIHIYKYTHVQTLRRWINLYENNIINNIINKISLKNEYLFKKYT